MKNWDGILAILRPFLTGGKELLERAKSWPAWSAGAVMLAVFLADVLIPLGFNVPALYLVALFILYAQGKTRQIWFPVMICAGLTLTGLFVSPRGGALGPSLISRLINIGFFAFAGFLAAREQVERARMESSERSVTRHLAELQVRSRALLSVTEDLRMEREKLAQRERELHVTVEFAPVAMVVADGSGRILLFNAEAERVFGYQRQEVLSKPVEILMPEHQRETHPGLRDRYLKAPEARPMGAGRHLFARRKDGSDFPVEIALTPLDLGPKKQILSTIVDITERKRAEDFLRQLSENLSRQVDEQTRDLRQARDAAEGANRAKSAFLANMSHEIRTPMNGIIGMTELLLKTPLSAEQRHYQDIVKESAESLLLLLNDILDLSKIEAGKLELLPVEFDPRDCVGSALQGLGYAASKKGVELACHIRPDVPHHLVGDVNRLHQVLINLAGNAVKFTEHGEILVDVQLESRDDAQATLHFLVRDTGCGIPAEKQGIIFESFTQVDSTARRRHGGSGLGLAISHQLVELMNGRIWVESEVNRGSTFHFTAQFGLGAEVAVDSDVAPEALQGRRILVVDDNATNREVLLEMLREWRAEPLLATSGPDAFALLEKLRSCGPGNLPEIVLLDMMMPGMDGAQVARQLRKLFGGDTLKIVILSSLSEPLSLCEMAQLGVDSLLSKPVRASQLLKVISRSLGINSGISEAPETLPSAGAPPAEVPHLHILLAEDNRVNRMVAVKLLKDRGHSVTSVENGEQALAALEQEDFDAVLMDVQMPVMDGLSATAAIRRKEQVTGRHLPIVALTANAMGGDRERCLEGGMDGYVAKPVRSHELFAALESAATGPLSKWHRIVGDPQAVPPADMVFDAKAFQASIGDRLLMNELIEVFDVDARDLIRDAKSALQQRDGSALHRAAHTLKGMIGSFSARIASECATQLSEQTRDGRCGEGVETLVCRVENEVTRLRDALRSFQNTLRDLEPPRGSEA